jgi:hypothetical protein
MRPYRVGWEVHGKDGDDGAFPHEGLRDGFADAAGGTGYKGGLVGESHRAGEFEWAFNFSCVYTLRQMLSSRR